MNPPLNLRQNNFDVLRFAMAILVIFSHSFSLMAPYNQDPEPLRRLTHGILSFGEIAVDVFFIISGYLITASWTKRPQASAFLRKRIARIVPGYLAAILFSVLVVAPLFKSADSHPVNGLFIYHFFTAIVRLHTFDVPGVFASNPWGPGIDGSLWTIAYEFWCYLGVMLLGVCRLLRLPMLVPIFLLAYAAYAFHYPLHGTHAVVAIVGDLGSWPRFATFFLVGAIAYRYQGTLPQRLPLALTAFLAIIASLFAPAMIDLVLPIPLTYLVLWLAFQPHFQLSNFAKHGDFSYGIYLYAWPIQQMLIACLLPHLTHITLFLIAASLAIIAGILSWHGVEKHFLGHRPSRPSPRPETRMNVAWQTIAPNASNELIPAIIKPTPSPETSLPSTH